MRAPRTALAVAAAAAILVVPAVATASTVTVGNDTVPRAVTDVFGAFAVADTRVTMPSDGVVTSFGYYAADNDSYQTSATELPFRFFVVDVAQEDGVLSGTVAWVSEEISPTGVGAASYVPPAPVAVRADQVVGVYFVRNGSIPFDEAQPQNELDFDPYTLSNLPVPEVGQAITPAGFVTRDYSYNVQFEACSYAIASPIAADGSSVFSTRRGVVPVKLTGCSAADLAPQVSVRRTSTDSPGPVSEVTSVSGADSGTTMRFDTASGQYVFNLATAGFGPGTYEVSIDVGDVTVATATFGLG